MVDAYDVDSPTGGDLVQIPEELRAIKERIGEETAGKMNLVLPAQKVDPLGSTGKTAAGNVTVDLANGTFQHYRISANTTFSFTVPALPEGTVPFFTLRLTNGGAHTITWPSGTRWPLGGVPALSGDGVDMLVFYKPYVNASFWEGVLIASNIREPA